MTEGRPLKLILGFAVPLLFGNLFQQFYNLVDTIIVGKFLGVKSLAAVGSTGSINFLIIGFCMGICNGFAIPIAQSFGAKNEKTLRKYVANSTWLALLFAVVMTIATVLLCRPILRLMRTPEDIIGGAYTYIVIIFAGIPATILYNMVSGILRAMGDSKTPLYFLIGSSIGNIFLDIVGIPEYPPGSALHCSAAHGCVGSCPGHGCIPGCFRSELSDLYAQKIRYPSCEKG